MDIEKLQQEIDEQSRNGRQTIYVKTSVMNELGVSYSTMNGEERVFVDKTRLENLIKQYKKEHTSFRDSLKVNVSNTPITQNYQQATNAKHIEKER